MKNIIKDIKVGMILHFTKEERTIQTILQENTKYEVVGISKGYQVLTVKDEQGKIIKLKGNFINLLLTNLECITFVK